MTDDQTTGASRRRFLKGAGVAAGAAGVTAALGSAPAGAVVNPANEVTLTVKTIDMSTGDVHSADLGTGAVAQAQLTTIGDLAYIDLRIVLGSSPDLNDEQICILGSDLPAGYRPAQPFPMLNTLGTVAGMGSGVIVDYAQSPITSYNLLAAWVDLTSVTGTPVMLFQIDGRGPFDASVNAGGTTPFGAQLNEGALITASSLYFAEPDA